MIPKSILFQEDKAQKLSTILGYSSRMRTLVNNLNVSLSLWIQQITSFREQLTYVGVVLPSVMQITYDVVLTIKSFLRAEVYTVEINFNPSLTDNGSSIHFS